MKYAKILPVILLLVAFVPLAFSQDSLIVMQAKEFGKLERAAVTFNHEKHSANMECLQCHHDYDAYLNNRGGEGQPCATCHTVAGKPGVPALREAFHNQCKTCHAALSARGKQSGPLTCGECHIQK
ncbi:MAG: cytochrome c family protein [Desulfobacteraceae bacterium]|nr:cytochrome c family protein [Desulfobacteraceae bacterium]